MDLLIKNDYKLYHVARMNITWTDEKKALIDICPPDDTKIDVFQWEHGVQTINVKDSIFNVCLQITPDKALEIGLEKKVLKRDVKGTVNNP